MSTPEQAIRAILVTALIVGALFVLAPDVHGACSSVPMFHGLDSYFICSNFSPVFAYASQLSQPLTVNTGSETITRNLAAGAVVVATDWGNGGILGCPQTPLGNTRVMIVVQGSDGQGIIVSISGADPGLGYIVETAHPFDAAGSTIFPLACSRQAGAPTIISKQVSGLQVTLDLHFERPLVYSDCDPDSVGMAGLGGTTCPDAFSANSSVSDIYTSLQPCTGAVAWNPSAWTTTGVRPDATGNAHLVLPLSTDSRCLYVGAKAMIAGFESPSVTGYVSIPPADCFDLDEDSYAVCQGDCDDHNPEVHPGHAEVCDGVDNDCDALTDEQLGQTTCGLGECTVTVANCVAGQPQTCLPGPPAAEVCDDRDNNCNGTVDDVDFDGDGSSACFGDCNDADPAIRPDAVERCNGIDDNCNGQIDDDAEGTDTDSDGVRNACDNCRFAYNPAQVDGDLDGSGNACDNCVAIFNPTQADQDADLRGDVCDNCPTEANSFQDDADGDRVGDVCDNCLLDYNPDQEDLDRDFSGDVCDLDDGLIYLMLPDASFVMWQMEAGFDSFNLYRGDLRVLWTSGLYTQDPTTVPLAARYCDLPDTTLVDSPDPPRGQGAFYLVTGNVAGVEGSLGTNSAGLERPNANPCP